MCTALGLQRDAAFCTCVCAIMVIALEISIVFDQRTRSRSPEEGWLRSVVETALVAGKAPPACEVSLVIAGQRRVRELNRIYLDEDRPTDVLSFPMVPSGETKDTFVSPPDGVSHLGEVIVSLPQAISQAEQHGHSAEREIAILIIHGVLHLLGHDHDDPAKERKMREKEIEILSLLDKRQSGGTR